MVNLSNVKLPPSIKNTYLIAGSPLELIYHNAASDGERDGLKSYEIGQSAAKSVGDDIKVQRLDKVISDY